MSGRLGELVALLETRGMLRLVVPAADQGGQDRSGMTAGGPGIAAVTLDSRAVGPGVLFAAAHGERADGHAYLDDAVARGAAAVIVEEPAGVLAIPQLVVAATRPAVAVAAAWSAGFPSRRLGVVGVTGTDGKTTTCHLIRAILEASDRPTGLAGTVDVIVGGETRGNPGRTTTPEAPELQALLAAMVEGGDGWAVIEASSHGLAQDRVGEIAWDVGVLTNLTEEHLEFHHTIEAYGAAKRRLFEALAVGPGNPEKGFGKTAVQNLDDDASRAFTAAAKRAGAKVIGYGVTAGSSVRLTDVRQDAERLHVGLQTPRWQGELALHLAGQFNAHNALAAVAVGEALALEPAAVRAGLEGVLGVPGRMERIEAGQPFVVVVDYAHTADALAKVIDELAPVASEGGGAVIIVFGSAGDRDRVKRPVMGRVAGTRCRLVIVTDEDPRTEDPEAIRDEIAVGAEAAGRHRGRDLLLIGDRRDAIRTAIAAARPGDVVLLAGKGHEKTIEMSDGDIAWDEASEARRALLDAGWHARR
jgi:UDP-N-acetylmuramoyl-L-alanyl-D-glutamate--2,6-diaminopimelate ligase